MKSGAGKVADTAVSGGSYVIAGGSAAIGTISSNPVITDAKAVACSAKQKTTETVKRASTFIAGSITSIFASKKPEHPYQGGS